MCVMKTNKLFLPLLGAAFALSACTTEDNPTTPAGSTYDAVVDNPPKIWTEDDEAVILGSLEDDGDMAAIKKGYTNIASNVGDKTKILIMDEITDEYLKSIDKVVFYNGGFAFINNPEKENLKDYADDLPFDPEEIDYEGLDLLGFTYEGVLFLNYVSKAQGEKGTSEGVETKKTEEPGAVPDFIKYSASDYDEIYDTEEWSSFQSVSEWMDAVEASREEIDEDEANARANTRADQGAMKDLSQVQGMPYTLNFIVEDDKRVWIKDGETHNLATLKWKCTAVYSVRQLFIYPGQGTPSGDYYIIQAHYSWDNSGIWKGEFDSAGYNCVSYPEWCQFITAPVMKEGYSCQIPVEGAVKPENANKQTKTTEERHFNITGKGSIGINSEKKGDELTAKRGYNLEASASWSWSSKKEKTEYQWDIYRVGSGAESGHKLVINASDLPEHRTGWLRKGYDNIKPELLSSTMDIHSSWMWYVPETKMDSEEQVIRIQCWFDPHIMIYLNGEASSYTRPQWWLPTANGSILSLPIAATNRLNAGKLIIENTFDNMTISNIEVTDAKSGKVVAKSDAANITKGKTAEFILPATNREYNITFKAGATAAEAKTYKNTDPVTLKGFTDETRISSAYAFQAK